MVQNLNYKFPMPNSGWETIKKIVLAYNAASGQDSPTVKDISELAGIHRPQVSANNKFLREIGLLQEEVNRLTTVGTALATGMELGYDSMVTEALQSSARSSPTVSQWLNMLRARGNMNLEQFKGQVITTTGMTAQSPGIQYIKSILDYLEATRLVDIDGDSIRYSGQGEIKGLIVPPLENEKEGDHKENRQEPPPPPPPPARGIPIPLGVRRVAHLQLPEDWTGKELPKLLKMIELALSDEME